MLAAELLAVGTSVDCDRRQGQIVAESIHLALDLLGKFAGGSHDQAVDKSVGLGHFGQQVDYGQQICGGFAGAGLRDGYEVVAVEHHRYCFFLYRGALLEVHGIKRVKQIVA